MDAKNYTPNANRTERSTAVRTAGPIRNLRNAAAFEDSQWPSSAGDHDAWLFGAAASADAQRADALAGRGMSVVGGGCDGCVRDLAAHRPDGPSFR